MTDFLSTLEALPEEQRWRQARTFMFEQPLPFFRELRRHRPVLRLPELTLATRFDDCAEILRRFDLFSVELYRPKMGEYWMAQDDTPAHWRDKSIMRALLDREDVPGIRDYVAERARAIFLEANGELDAVDGLTRRVPISLVQDRFGFVDSDRAKLQEWSYWNQMDQFWNLPFDTVAVKDPGAVIANRERVVAAMAAYLIGVVERRAQEHAAGVASDDPISRLLRLSLSGALRLPLAGVVLNSGGLLVGAVETTSHAVVNALDHILQEPGLAAEARAAAASDDAQDFDGYVFEALRFRPAFPYFFRTATQPVRLARGTDHETEIMPGETVLAVTHSAMFDEGAFDDPERFDHRRSHSNSFHFGLGLHECLGRAIGAVLIPEIARQALLLKNLRSGPVDRKGGPVPESWLWRWDP